MLRPRHKTSTGAFIHRPYDKLKKLLQAHDANPRSAARQNPRRETQDIKLARQIGATISAMLMTA
jgi:hypothetical protein